MTNGPTSAEPGLVCRNEGLSKKGSRDPIIRFPLFDEVVIAEISPTDNQWNIQKRLLEMIAGYSLENCE
jgi:hypothetical protein